MFQYDEALLAEMRQIRKPNITFYTKVAAQNNCVQTIEYIAGLSVLKLEYVALLAVMHGSIDVVQKLWDLGVLKNGSRRTNKIAAGNLKMLDNLVKMGFDPSNRLITDRAIRNSGFTVLLRLHSLGKLHNSAYTSAILDGNYNIVRWLESLDDFRITESQIMTAVIDYGVAIIESSKKASTNATPEESKVISIIMQTLGPCEVRKLIKSGKEKLFEHIIKKYAALATSDSALIYAITRGMACMVRRIVGVYGDVVKKPTDALFIGPIISGDVKTIRKLHKYGFTAGPTAMNLLSNSSDEVREIFAKWEKDSELVLAQNGGEN